jgi:cytochrome c-type biogenesis protein CcmF
VDTNLPIGVFVLLLISFVPLLVWGRNSFSKLLPKLAWAAGGAITAAAITLIYGYPGIGVLLIAVLGGSAAGMNLFLMTKLMRKRFSMSGGAMAHLGVGLMFLGVVASSAYDRSEKVMLKQGGVESAMGYDIKFNGPQFVPQQKGLRVELPLDVSKEGFQFTATPDIYSEQAQGQQPKRFPHPHIRRGLVSDLYISPVDFRPGRKSDGPGNQLRLKKGESVKVHDYELTFTGFDVTGMMERKGSHDMSVGANITVSHKGAEPVTLKPVITVGQLHGPSSKVKLPGSEEAYLTLVRIEAGSKTVGVVYDGPGAPDIKAPAETPASMIAEVSIKPGMTVLWLGVSLILLGGCVAIVRHSPK